MRPGKFSESVLKRSVLKQIKTKREEVNRGAEVGEDCAFFSFEKKEGTLITTAPIIADEFQSIAMQLTAIVNNVAAAGGEPVGVVVSSMLPDKILESVVQRLSGELERACHNLNLQISGGNTVISKAVNKPVLNITVIGKKDVVSHRDYHVYEAGQDILLTKYAGLAGTAILSGKEQDKLQERLPAYIVENGILLEKEISVLPESRIAMEVGVKGMHDVSRGGIFSALWELAEKGNVGIEVDLKKIPVRQETIEICEVLGVNPYELYGAGALLIVSDKGNQLLHELEKQQIPASIIGKITKENGKVILNGEEVRFLDRPKSDAIEPWLRDNEA